jgi:hypothetical protein
VTSNIIASTTLGTVVGGMVATAAEAARTERHTVAHSDVWTIARVVLTFLHLHQPHLFLQRMSYLFAVNALVLLLTNTGFTSRLVRAALSSVSLFVTMIADHELVWHLKTTIAKTLNVLLRRRRPACFIKGAKSGWTAGESQNVFLASTAIHSDNGGVWRYLMSLAG